MKNFTRSCCVLLALGSAAGCSRSPRSDGPAVNNPRLSQVRNLVKTGMPAPLALGAAQGVLGPPTLVDGDSSRWILAGDARCTELRIVVGARTGVQGVSLFTVMPVSGAQYKDCMAAVGMPVIEDEGEPTAACPPA